MFSFRLTFVPGLLALGVAVAGDGMIVMLPFLSFELVWG